MKKLLMVTSSIFIAISVITADGQQTIEEFRTIEKDRVVPEQVAIVQTVPKEVATHATVVNTGVTDLVKQVKRLEGKLNLVLERVISRKREISAELDGIEGSVDKTLAILAPALVEFKRVQQTTLVVEEDDDRRRKRRHGRNSKEASGSQQANSQRRKRESKPNATPQSSGKSYERIADLMNELTKQRHRRSSPEKHAAPVEKQPTGKPSMKPSGKLSMKPSGKPSGKASGKTSGKTSGKATGKTSGKNSGKTSDAAVSAPRPGVPPSPLQTGPSAPQKRPPPPHTGSPSSDTGPPPKSEPSSTHKTGSQSGPPEAGSPSSRTGPPPPQPPRQKRASGPRLRLARDGGHLVLIERPVAAAVAVRERRRAAGVRGAASEEREDTLELWRRAELGPGPEPDRWRRRADAGDVSEEVEDDPVPDMEREVEREERDLGGAGDADGADDDGDDDDANATDDDGDDDDDDTSHVDSEESDDGGDDAMMDDPAPVFADGSSTR